MSNLPEVRHTVESLFTFKVLALSEIAAINSRVQFLDADFRAINGYSPIKLSERYDNYGEHQALKYVDRTIWRYLSRMFELEKYMLCTEWEKMSNEIEEFKTPVYTVETAHAWIAGLKSLIHENIKTLVKSVFRSATDGTYYVGTGYNSKKKKRNNNGVDKMFILNTYDYNRIFSYWTAKPTFTDDLEKVCYIMDGKKLPDETLMSVMKATETSEASNEYFAVRVCKNGNTHYTISDETREKLNRYGPEGAVIGENIKIKVFSDRWAC